MTLRLAVNATCLLSPFTGVAQYTRQLMQEICARPEVECLFFYGAAWVPTLRQAPLPGFAGAKSAIKRFLPNAYEVSRLAQQVRFRAIRRFGADVYHEPNYYPFRGVPVVVTTIHDLSPLRFPGTHPAARVRFMEKHLPEAIAASRYIITDSMFIRDELIALCGVPREKVRAIYLASGTAFRERHASEVAGTLQPHGLSSQRYVLSVGTLEPRKNLLSVFEAYRQLPAAMARTYPLVVVGQRGWLSGPIEAQMKALLSDGRVRFLGFQTDDELANLYAGARAFVYPSLYEGFGLPPLEAMACGAPAIVSNRASLPEIVGDAGIHVEAEDPSALREALVRLIEDDSEYHARRHAGMRRAALFSWKRCADETIEVYRAALA